MAHADALEFEQAPASRDQIGALSRVLHRRAVEDNSGVTTKDADVLAVRVEGGKACVNLAMVRGGRHLGDRPVLPAHVGTAVLAGDEDERPLQDVVEVQVLEAFIAQHYLDALVPPLLITSHAVDKSLIETLAAASGVRVTARSTSRAKRAAPGWRCASRVRRSSSRSCWPRRARSSRARVRWSRRSTGSGQPRHLSHRVFRHQPHRRRSDAGIVRGVRNHRMQNANTAATTSRASPAATTTPPCAGAHAPLCQAGRGRIERLGAPADLVLVDGGRGRWHGARVFEELGIDLGLIVGVEGGKAARSARGTGVCRRAGRSGSAAIRPR